MSDSDQQKQLVIQLAQSSLESDERMRLNLDRQEMNKAEMYTAMNGVVAQHKKFQTTTITRFQEVNTKMDDVASQVSSVKSKVERMEQQQHDVLQQEAKKSAKDKQFMSPLAAMFNTKTGFIAFMPVQYTNGSNQTYKVVVLSMPNLVWYNKIGRPDGQHCEIETRSYFGKDDPIRLHVHIPYKGFCSILEKTPFKPRVASKNESWNRFNFLMVSLDEWKRVERENEEDYPNRPRTLPLIPRKDRGFAHLGNNVAYTQGAPGDLSTGFYQPFERSFNMEEMALVPAMGRTWTSEALDIPIIRDLFGVTEEERGKYHIVGGKLEAATIKTHAEAQRENSPAMKAAMQRRLMRAKHRDMERLEYHNKKRKR